MDNSVCHRFTDGRFDISDFFQRRIQLGRKACHSQPSKPFIAAFAQKIDLHFVFCSHSFSASFSMVTTLPMLAARSTRIAWGCT